MELLRIDIQDSSGGICSMAIVVSEKISEIKAKYLNQIGKPGEIVDFIFKSVSLDDNKTISDYSIKSRDIIISILSDFTKYDVINSEPLKDTQDDLERKISFLENLGYNRDICEESLKIAKCNISLATEVLYSGFLPTDKDKLIKRKKGQYKNDSSSDQYEIMSTRTPDSIRMISSQLSSSDKEAIKRLTKLGVDEATVIQVYIACENDEEKTKKCLITMI